MLVTFNPHLKTMSILSIKSIRPGGLKDGGSKWHIRHGTALGALMLGLVVSRSGLVEPCVLQPQGPVSISKTLKMLNGKL